MHNTSHPTPHVAKRRRAARRQATGGRQPPALLFWPTSWNSRPTPTSPHSLFCTLPIRVPRPQPSTVVGAILPESCGTIVCETAPHCSPFIFHHMSVTFYRSPLQLTADCEVGTARLDYHLVRNVCEKIGKKQTDSPGSLSQSSKSTLALSKPVVFVAKRKVRARQRIKNPPHLLDAKWAR
jgi:hypothetical protein